MNLLFYFIKMFLIFFFLPAVSSSILLSKLLYGQSTEKYSKLSDFDYFHLTQLIASALDTDYLFSTYSSPFVFDEKCLEIHNTHVWTYVGCDLPKFCGEVSHVITDKSFWGYEDIICFSFHRRNSKSQLLKFHSLSFTPFNLTLSRSLILKHPIPSLDTVSYRWNKRDTLLNVRVERFFDNYYLVEKDLSFALLPKLCSDQFLPESKDLPASVVFNLDANKKRYSVSHTTYHNLDCELVFYPTFQKLLSNYDLPISWNGVMGFHKTFRDQYQNDDPDIIIFYQKNYKDFVYPINSYVSASGSKDYLVSNELSPRDFYIIARQDASQPNIPSEILPSNLSKTETFYFDYHTKNKAFLGSVFSGLVDIIADLFFELFDAFESVIERLAAFIFKLFYKILGLVLDTVYDLEIVDNYYFLEYLFLSSLLLVYFKEPWPVIGCLVFVCFVFGLKKN